MLIFYSPVWKKRRMASKFANLTLLYVLLTLIGDTLLIPSQRLSGQEPLLTESHPDPYRSDIDNRRAQYKASRSGTSQARAPTSASIRTTPTSSDDLEEDQEDLLYVPHSPLRWL